MTCEILEDVVVRLMNEGKAVIVHTAVTFRGATESHILQLGLLPGVLTRITAFYQ